MSIKKFRDWLVAELNPAPEYANSQERAHVLKQVLGKFEEIIGESFAEETYVFMIYFDDHDSYYNVPESLCRKILTNGCPKDAHDITEEIITHGTPASISSDCEVAFSYCDMQEFFVWNDLKEELEAEFGEGA